jgi:hypothetical protein
MSNTRLRKQAQKRSPQIKADPNVDNGDEDQGIEKESILSTELLTESIFEDRKLHGLTFRNSETTKYRAPNHEQQNEGLDIIHNALVMLPDDKLYLAPIGDNPGYVLDVVTGGDGQSTSPASFFSLKLLGPTSARSSQARYRRMYDLF